MNRARFLNLVALCLSDGGVGFSSDTMYIHFTNSSEALLNLFRKEIRKFSSARIHEQHKSRGTTLRVFDKKLVRNLLSISPSYRTRPCNHFPRCPILRNPKEEDFGFHNHFSYEELVFAEIVLPDDLFQTNKDKAKFLQIYSSCDGYPSIFPRQHSWSAVERMVAIVCHHPNLKQRLHQILTDLEIPHKVKQFSLVLRSKDALRKFKEEISFVDGVTMTGNSRYWKDYEKNKVLELILKSYELRFISRDPSVIISQLRSRLLL